MICLRVDVDYAYSNRWKSFVCVGLGIKKPLSGYLENCHVIADLVNKSKKDVRAYWFFNSFTFPDKTLLSKLNSNRHEVGLHVINNPFKETLDLESCIGRKIYSYTIHGTERFLGQLIWKRSFGEKQAKISGSFGLRNFMVNPIVGLDVLCYRESQFNAYSIAKERLAKGHVLHLHPDWLFQNGTWNHRAACFWLLEKLLMEED